MEKITREKNVVVPTAIQTMFPRTNQETKALQSSTFHGRALLIVNHLNRTFNRDQNPVAAASNSSLVGAWGIFGRCGRCRYLLGEEGDSSGTGIFGSFPAEVTLCSETGPLVFWLLEELLFLFITFLARRPLECISRPHDCLTKGRRRFLKIGAVVYIVFSSLAAQAVVIEGVAALLELMSKNKMLPEAKLLVYATFRDASYFVNGLLLE